MRRYRWLLVAIAAVLVMTAAPASACSCLEGDNRERLERADGAFIGTALSRTSPNPGTVVYTFSVDEPVKGEFEDTVEVEAPSTDASCGLEVSIGDQTGLLLTSIENGWSSSLCQQIHPDRLREAAAPMPEPDGEGPIAMIAGGNWGEMGLFALDDHGRTLLYGKRDRGADVADVCPGSRFFIESPWGGQRRWVVRRTATFEVVDVVDAPKNSFAHDCLSADASEILVYSIIFGEPKMRTKLYRYSDGTFHKLYEGSSTWFEIVGDHVYLTEGNYGRNVRMLDLSSGQKTFIARLPRNVRQVSVNAGETHLATTAGAGTEKVIVIDLQKTPATVKRKDLGFAAGEVTWIDKDSFVYLPGGHNNSTVMVFDHRLRRESSLDGYWETLDADFVGDVAYGAGWGVVFRATLPGGPAEVLREFPSPEIFTVVAVPDEVLPDPPQ